jgi:hypothetical protein
MSSHQGVEGRSLLDRLQPLISREMASLVSIDAAVAREEHPDYVVMFQSAKMAKQANVEQMVTVLRMQRLFAHESQGVRGYLEKGRAVLAARVSGTTATLIGMRSAAHELLEAYTEAVTEVDGLARRALRKALGRTLVQMFLLTAHIARRTGRRSDLNALRVPLDRLFAAEAARACMRCHLDRPGARPPLERTDPHPYTYLCGACHAEVRDEFPPDLASQMDRWPWHLQEARVLQHALGRTSVLRAIHTVLHPLCGLPEELPKAAAEQAVAMPAMEPSPSPGPGERSGILSVEARTQAESEYVAALFDPSRVRRSW